MNKQTEAMKLALEALEGLEALLLSMGLTHLIVYGDAEKAITNLQKALANEALDKKAENARELGLDYEPAKDNSNYRFDPPGLDPSHQKPVAWWIPKAKQFCLPSSDGTRPFAKAWEPLYTYPSAQQEPVAVPTTPYEHRKFVLVGREWYERFAAFHDDCQISERLTWQEKTIRLQGYENGWNDAQRYLREPQASPPTQPQQEPVVIHQFRSPHCSDWYDGVPDHHDGYGPYEVRTLYTSPPAQRTWVGLTDEEFQAIKDSLFRQQGWDGEGWDLALKEAIEAKLKEKNT